MDALKNEHCVPIRRGGSERLSEAETAELLRQLPDWELIDDEGVQKLRRRMKTGDYHLPPQLINELNAIADAEDHHPVIEYEPKYITFYWWTHAIDGLHRNDFIMAAKTDALFEQAKDESGMDDVSFSEGDR